MKFETKKGKIMPGLQSADRVSGKNLSLPILECVLLETVSQGVILRSTNLDLGVEIKIAANVEVEGKVAIPGRVFIAYLNNLGDDDLIKVELKDGVLHVNSQKAKARIKTVPFEDFPIIPRVNDGAKCELSSEELSLGLKSVSFACGAQSMKPELASVYVRSDGDFLIFASTDSFRLAEKRVATKKRVPAISMLIPFRNVVEIIKLLEHEKGDTELVFDQNHITLETNEMFISSRVIDGVFPDYKQIIPKETKTKALVLKKDLMQALKTTNVFADKFNMVSVDINVSKKHMSLTSKNNDVGESEYEIEMKAEGDSVALNFNQRYINDCFQSIQTESIELDLVGPGRPMLIRGHNDKTFLYVVMPMNK